MKLTVRYVKQRGAGRETHDVPFSGDKATIGRGTNQSIQILDRRVPLSHSAISTGKAGLELRAESGHNFTVNGEISRRAELGIGDVVNILGHTITVLAGEGDESFVLEVEVDTETVEPLRNRFKTRLWELNFPVRTISWTLFLLVLLVTIGIPSVGFVTGMAFVRATPLPDDGWWLTGKLHDTHAFLGEQCEFCHALPFIPARDEECLNCHLSVRHHFDKKLLSPDHKADYCHDCHREHSADAIIRSDQKVCTACHGNLVAAGFDTDRLRDASDFLDDHPSFRVSMLQMNEDETWTLVRRELWDDDALEASNLKFSHELHMAEDGIDGPDGVAVLECDDCHVSEKGGLRMKTVTMERHCAGCHELAFDPDTPDREVPHGRPAELMEQLRGYYAYQFLHADRADATSRKSDGVTAIRQREARRPGNRRDRAVITEFLAGQQMVAELTTQASAYVDQHVAEAAANMFERQTCVVCHEISSLDGPVPFKVEPVKLTPDWFPMSEFSHEKHKNMACDGCHDALYSTSATDVLMPDISTCRTCHGGEGAKGRVQSTCIACHKFHLDTQGPMGMRLLINKEGDLVDTDGNFVDEAGNLIDADGNRIDRDGNLIDEEGNILAPIDSP